MDAELSVKSWRILTFWEHDQHIRITHETLWPSPALLGRFLKNGTHEHQFFISLLNGNLYYSFFGVLGYLDSVTSQRGVTACVRWQTQMKGRAMAIRVVRNGHWKGAASDHILWTGYWRFALFALHGVRDIGLKDWV